MGNEGDTHVRERSHLQGPQLLAHPSSLPSSPSLWPFLFNTVALSASPLAHCLSRHLPHRLICTSASLPFSFPMHIIRMCDPTKWICPHIKDLYSFFFLFFLLEKQKGHAADRMRLVSLCKHPYPNPPSHPVVAGAGKAPPCIFISARLLRILKSLEIS